MSNSHSSAHASAAHRESGGTPLPVNIGEAARLSGISARMVRHYEGLGLLGEVHRTESGYRQYSPADVHTLRFIKRSRDMGFSMEQVAELVDLWHNRRRTSASVKRIAQSHLEELERRIAAMQGMQRTLAHLVHCCQGDQRPNCPILDDLAGIH
jgi:Cu(I)-responsive transcriptional regulator